MFSQPTGRRVVRQLARGMMPALLVWSATGCARYWTNRYYDFRDTLALGVGATAENPITGAPPSLGALVEATDFLQLGWITFNGMVAETELRGTYVGPEYSKRAAFFFWQRIHKNQPYQDALYMNRFKEADFPWCYRMESLPMRLGAHPAKQLHYERWADATYQGNWLRHRGWQYWGYLGASLAISDPLLTHHGFMVRAGVDVSEVFDFLAGWFGYDFRKDDMTAEEYRVFRSPRVRAMPSVPIAPTPTPTLPTTAPTPAPTPAVQATPAPGVSQADYDRLVAQNRDLAQQLEQARARIQMLERGIEFTIPESVLFASGSDALTTQGRTLLRQVAQRIRTEYPNHQVIVEGHTDNEPIRASRDRFRSNWELGAGRALAVLHFLIDECGLPQASMAAMTLADTRPVATNDTPEGRQQNRRAVVVLRALQR